MKRLYKYACCLLLSISFVACEDFLTVLPESSYSVDGAYKTQADFEQAIAGVYAQQQELYRLNNCWFRVIIGRSDDTKNGSRYMFGLDQFIDDDNVEILTNSWKQFWVIINRSNLILDKIDAIEFKDEKIKKNIKGEAYTLRAWAYWSLGWQYGGMPLIDKALTSDETRKIARSSQEETFAFAAGDYKLAMDLLPDVWDSKNVGRVTRYAAEGMLARLLLFQSKFTEAKPLLADIIGSDKYTMEKKYIDCFTDSKDNGPERVWEVQFTGGQLGEGQHCSTGMLPEEYKDVVLMPFSGYSTAMKVSVNCFSMYESGDLRKDISVVTNLNLNGQIDNISYYILKFCHYDGYTPKDQQDWANNLPILRYTDVKMMYAEVLNEEAYIANGEAFDMLNEVRTRAGLPELTSVELPNKEAFKNALIKERRVEFAFEGLRWNDLVRWGIASSIMTEHFKHEDEGEGRYRMDDYQKLFAIPFNEISRYNDESVMWQNLGY